MKKNIQLIKEKVEMLTEYKKVIKAMKKTNKKNSILEEKLKSIDKLDSRWNDSNDYDDLEVFKFQLRKILDE